MKYRPGRERRKLEIALCKRCHPSSAASLGPQLALRHRPREAAQSPHRLLSYVFPHADLRKGYATYVMERAHRFRVSEKCAVIDGSAVTLAYERIMDRRENI